MEYINKFLVLAGLNLRLLRLKNEHENVDKIAELENIIGAISETETEDVVERSKIDKAIEEIEFLRQHRAKYITEDNKICIDSGEVLKILKNIGE